MAASVLPARDLLSVKPDELLSSYSLSHCVEVGHSLAREVDKKREELRVMVGERYRDLIEAADTIQNMKLSAEKVIVSVEGMQASCGHLHQQAALSCLTSAGEPVQPPDSPNTPYLAVAASTKLLLSVPERIWAAVESGKLAEGAQIFLLAQYVHTGLQGDAGGGLTPEKVCAWFPVISRQWATIHSLQWTLLSQASQVLVSPSLLPHVAADSLLTFLLLKNCTLDELFSEFLSLRQDCVSSVLLSGRTQPARSALPSLANTVIHSVSTVHTLFLGDLLLQCVRAIKSGGATVSLLGPALLGPVGGKLPGPVLGFRPRLSEVDEAGLEEGVVQAGLGRWLGEVGEGAKGEARTLLQYVSSVQGMAGVREELWKALSQHTDWKRTSLAVLGSHLCIWDSFYRDVVTSRVLEIVQGKVGEVMANVRSEVKVVLQDWEAWQGQEWAWQETSKDVMSGRGKNGRSGLGLQCAGWDPAVQTVLGTLETGVGGVWAGVEQYCTGHQDTHHHAQKGEEETTVFNRFGDSELIRKSTGETIQAAVAQLVKDCRKEAETRVEQSSSIVFLILGRILQAVLHLCPSLTAALGENSDLFKAMENLLDKEAESCFSVWIESRLTQFSSSLSCISSSSPLTVIPTWDKVTIEETGDSGEQISSLIRIPASPSLPLHSALLSLSSSLHSSHPYSFPPSVLSSASLQLLQLLLSHYTSLSDQTISQNIALQFSFDLRFLQTVFVSRNTKESLATTFTSLLSRLEANIDPFDLSVFSHHLESRVRWAAARSVSGLGCLVAPDRVQIITSHRPPSTAASNQNGHNVLHLPTVSAPRFQLLPLASTPAPPSSLGVPGLGAAPAVTEPRKAGTRRNIDRSPVAQTATSFFGSMSQSWFGGSTNS